MKNNKGFTLTEVMVVVIVIGILAALSIPFLVGYAREARNERAKAVLYMVAQGVKNFRSDFPTAAFANNGYGVLSRQNLNASTVSCALSNMEADNYNFSYTDLIKCSYLPNVDYGRLKYKFYLGNGNGNCSACGQGVSSAFACMVGDDGGDFDSDYCAYIDINNTLHEVNGN